MKLLALCDIDFL